jgi:hypothetical protein
MVKRYPPKISKPQNRSVPTKEKPLY